MDNPSHSSKPQASGLATTQHLERWRAEWQASQTAGENQNYPAPPIPRPTDDSGQVFNPADYDGDPNGFIPGVVRVLSASITGDAVRPIYVLVLENQGEGEIRIAPFSDFHAPATDREMLVSADPEAEGFPCVLQIWNSMDCPRGLLGRSWFSRQVPDEVVRNARILDRDLPLPPESAMLAGAPLLDTQDPRHDYIAQETRRLEHFSRLALEFYSPTADVILFPDRANSFPALAAAGSPEERELDYHVWEHPPSGATLHLSELVGRVGGYTLRVEGDTSGDFEGATVMDGSGRSLGRIEGGTLGGSANPLRFLGRRMRVFSAEGTPLSLVRREK
jgi:hypothetical protein